MQLELLNDQGQAASKFEAPETVFEIPCEAGTHP